MARRRREAALPQASALPGGGSGRRSRTGDGQEFRDEAVGEGLVVHVAFEGDSVGTFPFLIAQRISIGIILLFPSLATSLPAFVR